MRVVAAARLPRAKTAEVDAKNCGKLATREIVAAVFTTIPPHCTVDALQWVHTDQTEIAQLDGTRSKQTLLTRCSNSHVPLPHSRSDLRRLPFQQCRPLPPISVPCLATEDISAQLPQEFCEQPAPIGPHGEACGELVYSGIGTGSVLPPTCKAHL